MNEIWMKYEWNMNEIWMLGLEWGQVRRIRDILPDVINQEITYSEHKEQVRRPLKIQGYLKTQGTVLFPKDGRKKLKVKVLWSVEEEKKKEIIKRTCIVVRLLGLNRTLSETYDVIEKAKESLISEVMTLIVHEYPEDETGENHQKWLEEYERKEKQMDDGDIKKIILENEKLIVEQAEGLQKQWVVAIEHFFWETSKVWFPIETEIKSRKPAVEAGELRKWHYPKD